MPGHIFVKPDSNKNINHLPAISKEHMHSEFPLAQSADITHSACNLIVLDVRLALIKHK